MKHSKAFIATVLWALASLLLSARALAPNPPAIVVNHGSKQCALLYTGDECETCSPAEGWQVLEGAWSLEDCPTGYSVVGEIPPGRCEGLRHWDCCTEGHTGAAGACSDIFVNRRSKQCAFVEDFDACPQIPRGWEKNLGLCLRGYNWPDDIECSNPTNLLLVGSILAALVLVILGVLLARRLVKK